MAFKVINNEVITDSSVLQNTTIDESNVLNNVFNVTDGTTSQQINRGGTVTFTAGAGVTITQLNGTVTISSDSEGIEDLISPLLVHPNHTYINATYDDINDQVLLAVNITTDGVAEGSTNLYYDDALVDARIALQTGIYLDLSGKDTDDLVQGSTNLYYDDSLARAAISASGDLSYNNTTGVISYSTPTNVSTFTNDAGYLTSYTDTNTTYSISSETGTGGANLRLTGSDTSTDDVLIAGGTNVTVTRTDANTITISSTDTDTTYTAGSGIDLTGTTFSHSDTSSQSSLTALVGANVVSDIDVDGFGHVTALATRTMTLNDLGYTGATNADYYHSWNLHVGGIDRGDVLSSETIDFVAGGGIDLTYSTTNDNTITIAHTDTSAAANLTASSRTYVSGLTFDTYGHITGYTTGTETVTDTNNYVSSLAFNTGDGVLTANRSGLTALTVDLDGRYLLSSDYVDTYTSGATFNTSDGVITFTRNDATTYTVDIDGRYLQSYTETQTLQDVTDLGATTTNAISITNTTSSTSPTTGALKVSGGVGIAENLYIGGDTNIAGDTLISGNLTVLGTTTTVDVASLSISDNLIYLNNGGTATITNAVGNGSTVTYTADNNFSAGYSVDVTGVNPSAYNVSGATITSANATSFTISSTATGTYVSGGSARAHTNTNVDLGWAGSYNDGSYAHAGIFRDATDGRFKIFDGYTPEPDDSIDIDTTHASFSLADIQAATFIGNLTGNASTATSAGKWTTPRTITLGGDLTGNVNIDGSTNVTLTATIAANSVALGTDTTGNYVGTLAAGTSGVQSGTSGLTISATAGEGTAATIAHADTSTAANLSATSRTYVNSLTFDTYGHVTAYGTATETVTDTDTTYSISSETGTGGANLRLTAGGSGSGTDDVLFAGGTNVTVARTDANTITISSTDTNTTYSAGAGIDLTGTTFSHTDTSTAANLTASGRRYVTGLTFDTYGHVTGYSTGTETVVNTDTNTTYDHLAVTTTGGALLRLHGSDGVNDDVKFASGSNVTVAYTDANTITISSTDTDTNNYVTGLSFNTSDGVLTATRSGLSDLTVDLDGRYLTSASNTTYTISAETGTGGANLRLTGSDASTDNVLIEGGTNVTVTHTDANTITISSTDTNTTYSAGAGIDLTGTTFSHTDTSTAANLTASGRTYVTGLTFDTYGHVTGYSTGTETVVDTNTTSLPVENSAGTVQFTSTQTTGIQFAGSGATSVAFDAANQRVTFSSTDTNTTYSAGTGLSLVGTTFSNAAPDQTVTLTGSGATSVSGTYPNFTISSTDTVYTLPAATSTVLGGIELFSDTVQSVAANAVSATASRTYGVQVNSAGQAVVNVPWVDTNTTYSVATTSANGLMSSTDKTKLDGIEAGATADQTAAEILALLLTVDGAGSGLDADTVDGLSSAAFLRADANDTATGIITFSNTTATTSATTGAVVVTGGVGVGGSIYAGGDVTAYSDERLKDDIETITDAVNKVEQLRGVTYTRKSDGIASTGVIAQDVEKVLPQAVATDEDGMMSVKYGNMVGLLIEAIKEQNETIKGMQAEIAELKARLNS